MVVIECTTLGSIQWWTMTGDVMFWNVHSIITKAKNITDSQHHVYEWRLLPDLHTVALFFFHRGMLVQGFSPQWKCDISQSIYEDGMIDSFLRTLWNFLTPHWSPVPFPISSFFKLICKEPLLCVEVNGVRFEFIKVKSSHQWMFS